MKTITWGSEKLLPEWVVDENTIPGYCRVYYIEGGDTYYDDGDIKVQLKKGCVYIFPSHSTYSLIHNKADTIECTWVHLSLFPNIITQLIEIDNVYDYISIFKLIKYEHKNRKEPQSIIHKLSEMFVQMCYLDGYIIKPHSSVLMITDYIRENLQSDINISKVASHFGYSNEYFIRLFKQHMGITPYQFLVNSRLDMACSLLRENHTVQSISNMVGYKDVKTFNHAFKLNFGKTPTEYRKSYRFYI